MARIEPEFDAIRARRRRARHRQRRRARRRPCAPSCSTGSRRRSAPTGRVRLLLHSIAFGNLKLLAPERRARPPRRSAPWRPRSASRSEQLGAAVNRLFADGLDELAALADAPAYPASASSTTRTSRAPSTPWARASLTWTQALLARGLFADDARVIGMTSEGNQRRLEGLRRGRGGEGRARVGGARDGGRARALRHPRQRRAGRASPTRRRCARSRATSTSRRRRACAIRSAASPRPRTSRDVICLLATDEAAWINGEVIRVDGGEHVSGALA